MLRTPVAPAARAAAAAAAAAGAAGAGATPPLHRRAVRRGRARGRGGAVALGAAGRVADSRAERERGTIGDRERRRRGGRGGEEDREGRWDAGARLSADPTKTRLGKSGLEVCRVINGLCQVRAGEARGGGEVGGGGGGWQDGCLFKRLNAFDAAVVYTAWHKCTLYLM